MRAFFLIPMLVLRCGGTTSGVDASIDATQDTTQGGCNCQQGRTCCNGACVNTYNDPFNCGACGTKCSGQTPYCDGTCKAAPCADAGPTCSNGSCCGAGCCSQGQLCCAPSGPVGGGPPSCFTPTKDQPTCPQGCAPQCISDRNVKQDIAPVDDRAVLDALSTVPVSTWAYKSDPKTRHIGPMAQDLHAAFGYGDTDKAYDAVDAHGVAFASIRALRQMLEEQSARIDRLERENQRLREQGSSELDRRARREY